MKAYLVSDNHDSLVGMRLAGIEGTLVHTPEETHDAIREALKIRDLAILAITEKAAEMAEDAVRQLRERGELPLVKLRRGAAPLLAQGDHYGPNDGRNGHTDGSSQKSSHVVHSQASFFMQAKCIVCHS